MKTNNLPTTINNSISVRDDFNENFSNLSVHVLQSISNVYRTLNGVLYNQHGLDWLVYTQDSEKPELLKVPSDYKSYLAKHGSICIYKTINNEYVQFDIVKRAEIFRSPQISENLSQINFGQFFYSTENQTITIYNSYFELIAETKIPVFKKYLSFKGVAGDVNNQKVIFAAYPESCRCSYVYIFDTKLKVFKEFTIDVWFNYMTGKIDDEIIGLADLYEIYKLNIRTGELQFWMDKDNEKIKYWRHLGGLNLHFVNPFNQIYKLNYKDSIEKAEYLSKIDLLSFQFLNYGEANFYFKNTLMESTEIRYFNRHTLKWSKIEFPERLINAELQFASKFEYLILTHECFSRVLVIEHHSQAVVEQYQFPYTIDITNASLNSNGKQISVYSNNRPGCTLVNYGGVKTKIENTLSPGNILASKKLEPNKVIFLTQKEVSIFLEDMSLGMPVKLPPILSGNPSVISGNVLELSKNKNICMIAQLETKTIKRRGYWDKHINKIFYSFINTLPGQEKVVFSFATDFDENNSPKGCILKEENAAYVYGDNKLTRINLSNFEVNSVKTINYPTSLFSVNEFLIMGIFNNPPKTDLNPHLLVLKENEINFNKLNMEERISIGQITSNSFFYSYYSTSKKTSFWGKMEIIVDDNGNPKTKKVWEREGSYSVLNKHQTDGIIWLKQGYGPAHIAFYNEKKDEVIGHFYAFSDNNVIITTNTKYFFASDLSKLVFINTESKVVEPNNVKMQTNIYNNLSKTLETIGLKDKQVSLLKMLENLTNPPQSGMKQLPADL
jgi:hypothetical protein